MAGNKKYEKQLEEQITLEDQLTIKVTRFGEYLVNRRVGISFDDARELQGYVDTWRERGLSEAEAWSLIISVEAWAQARKAFKIAIVALVVSAVIGACSLLVAICSFLVTMLSSA